MRYITFVLAALMILATTASAYVQPGHLPQKQPQSAKTQVKAPEDGDGAPIGDTSDRDPGTGAHHRAPGDRPQGKGPTNPVPEPGTMMLASLGLIALGAAVRGRRR
jgi:hypothetical protein